MLLVPEMHLHRVLGPVSGILQGICRLSNACHCCRLVYNGTMEKQTMNATEIVGTILAALCGLVALYIFFILGAAFT